MFFTLQEMTMSAQLSLAIGSAPAAPQALFADRALTKPSTGREEGLPHAGACMQFAQDREIYGEGDRAETFYKVVSGVVRTCKFLSDGRRQIYAFHVAGDLFGFELGVEYTLSAEAVSDCTIVAYRRPRGAANASDEALSLHLFSHAMRSLARAQEHSLVLGRRSAVEKVAVFLLDWAAQSADGRTLALVMTRQDIADYLGLTIETVSRTMTQFERDGTIEMPTARQIKIRNTETLEDLCA
jgi:CRP/FNR family transcriptional regulator, nitrogen fixation regulation protein